MQTSRWQYLQFEFSAAVAIRASKLDRGLSRHFEYFRSILSLFFFVGQELELQDGWEQNSTLCVCLPLLSAVLLLAADVYTKGLHVFFVTQKSGDTMSLHAYLTCYLNLKKKYMFVIVNSNLLWLTTLGITREAIYQASLLLVSIFGCSTL